MNLVQSYWSFFIRVAVFALTFYWLMDDVHKSPCVPSHIGVTGIFIVAGIVGAFVLMMAPDGCLKNSSSKA